MQVPASMLGSQARGPACMLPLPAPLPLRAGLWQCSCGQHGRWGLCLLRPVPTCATICAAVAGPPGSSTNPLKQVLDAVGESVECVQYNKVQ